MDNMSEEDKKKMIIKVAICFGLLVAAMIIGIVMVVGK